MLQFQIGWKTSDAVSTAAPEAVFVSIAPADLVKGRCVADEVTSFGLFEGWA